MTRFLDYSAPHRVHNRVRLLINFFEHEVFVSAFFNLLEIKCNFFKLMLYNFIIYCFDFEFISCYGNHLAVKKINNLSGEE